MAKAIKETFEAFQEYVMPLFAEKFPPKGTNFIQMDAFQNFGATMLAQYDYTPEREQFLIKQSMFFIENVLTRTESHNTDTKFLEKLTNKMSDLLSFYIMYKYEIPTGEKAKNKLRLKVQAEIKNVLFDTNNYIARLKIKQEQNRDFRNKTKAERKTVIRERRTTDANDAYRTACQVRGIFAMAQYTPRKRR